MNTVTKMMKVNKIFTPDKLQPEAQSHLQQCIADAYTRKMVPITGRAGSVL